MLTRVSYVRCIIIFFAGQKVHNYVVMYVLYIHINLQRHSFYHIHITLPYLTLPSLTRANEPGGQGNVSYVGRGLTNYRVYHETNM